MYQYTADQRGKQGEFLRAVTAAMEGMKAMMAAGDFNSTTMG